MIEGDKNNALMRAVEIIPAKYRKKVVDEIFFIILDYYHGSCIILKYLKNKKGLVIVSENLRFKEMVRVSNKYIMTIEAELGGDLHPRIWIRNYKDIFEKLGFKEKSKMRLSKKTWGTNYIGRVFQKNA